MEFRGYLTPLLLVLLYCTSGFHEHLTLYNFMKVILLISVCIIHLSVQWDLLLWVWHRIVWTSLAEESDASPLMSGLLTFWLLLELMNLQPEHITNKTYPDYSRCHKCPPDTSVQSSHSHAGVSSWETEKMFLQSFECVRVWSVNFLL
jgi:hypothetical protein